MFTRGTRFWPTAISQWPYFPPNDFLFVCLKTNEIPCFTHPIHPFLSLNHDKKIVKPQDSLNLRSHRPTICPNHHPISTTSSQFRHIFTGIFARRHGVLQLRHPQTHLLMNAPHDGRRRGDDAVLLRLHHHFADGLEDLGAALQVLGNGRETTGWAPQTLCLLVDL